VDKLQCQWHAVTPRHQHVTASNKGIDRKTHGKQMIDTEIKITRNANDISKDGKCCTSINPPKKLHHHQVGDGLGVLAQKRVQIWGVPVYFLCLINLTKFTKKSASFILKTGSEWRWEASRHFGCCVFFQHWLKLSLDIDWGNETCYLEMMPNQIKSAAAWPHLQHHLSPSSRS